MAPFQAFFQDMGHKMRRFLRDQRGDNTALIAAVLLPSLAAMGSAIDLSRSYMMKSRLQDATDAAAIAGAKAFTASNRDTIINQFITANLVGGGVPIKVTNVTITPPVSSTPAQGDARLTISATAQLNTSFMRMFNIKTLDVEAFSEAARTESGVEVVLVLDNTGSMSASDAGGGKTRIQALKDAATVLVNTLYGSKETNDNVRVGILPYSHSVNVGKLIHNFASPASSPINVPTALATYVARGATYPDAWDSWKGCIVERPTVRTITSASANSPIPSGAKDILDTPHTVDGKWEPYLAPTVQRLIPSGKTYTWEIYNQYKQSGTWLNKAWEGNGRFYVDSGGSRFATIPSYAPAVIKNTAGSAATAWGTGPSLDCVRQALLPSTKNTKTQLLNYIKTQLITAGYTYSDIGAMWGYRMLSPGSPLVSDVNWYNPLVQKAMIIMTDGEITGGTESMGTAVGYTAYGNTFDYKIWPSISESGFAQAHEKRFEMVCQEAKKPLPGYGDDKMTIYTITFAFSGTLYNQKSHLYRNCASSPDKYYNAPNATTLSTAFYEIATDLAKLRLSK